MYMCGRVCVCVRACVMRVSVYVHVCVRRACVRVSVRACVNVGVCARARARSCMYVCISLGWDVLLLISFAFFLSCISLCVSDFLCSQIIMSLCIVTMNQTFVYDFIQISSLPLSRRSLGVPAFCHL